MQGSRLHCCLSIVLWRRAAIWKLGELCAKDRGNIPVFPYRHEVSSMTQMSANYFLPHACIQAYLKVSRF